MSDNQDHGSTFDITPVGAQTPEGCARIKNAMECLSQSHYLCADALSSFVGALSDVSEVAEMLTEHGVPEDEACELEGQVRDALYAWKRASEELLRATCGRPAAS